MIIPEHIKEIWERHDEYKRNKTMKKDDGGPVFPHMSMNFGGEGQKGIWKESGMSLRDWFAGMSLCAGKISPNYNKEKDNIYENIAETAYKIADAMIEERSKIK